MEVRRPPVMIAMIRMTMMMIKMIRIRMMMMTMTMVQWWLGPHHQSCSRQDDDKDKDKDKDDDDDEDDNDDNDDDNCNYVPTTRVVPDPPRVCINDPSNLSVVIFLSGYLQYSDLRIVKLLSFNKKDKSETIAKPVSKR